MNNNTNMDNMPIQNNIHEQNINQTINNQQPIENTQITQENINSNLNNTTEVPHINEQIQENSHFDQNQLQNQLQSIPTVDQKPEQFINNIQTQNQEKQEEKKEGVNIAFVIIMFIVILAAIIFLFPILAKYI